MDLNNLKKIGEEIVEEHKDEFKSMMLNNLINSIRSSLKESWSSPITRVYGSIIDQAINEEVKMQMAENVKQIFLEAKPELLKLSHELMKAQMVTLHEAILKEWMEVMGNSWKRSEFLKRLFGREEE